MGHVNNAVYLTYLEQARFSHWRALGIARGSGHIDSTIADGSAPADVPGVIIARAEIDYKRPAKYGDQLEVRVGYGAIGRTSFTYEYEIVDTAGPTVALAKTVIVRFDYAIGRPVPLTDDLKTLLTTNLLGP